MAKKYSIKFWIFFWLLAAAMLAAWYVFLQVKYRNIGNLKIFAEILPLGKERKNEIGALLNMYENAGGFEKEQNFLVLFQNNLELRPGGGFVGAFAVLGVKNGKIEDIKVFDTGVFDKNIPDSEGPKLPYPDDIPYASSLAGKMRDSNWSPDFRDNAEEAEKFWRLGGGKSDIDGVAAINTDVLNSILAITGPVKIEGYPGEYRDENAILQLEYQVEKGYLDQGIAKGERKNIMGELADMIIQKIHNFTFSEKLALAGKIENHLKRKDIQIFFKNSDLQLAIEKAGWAGKVKETRGDYLMIVDANLNALKSDYCVKRKAEYGVDLTQNELKAVLSITYEHTCRAKDWMTTNYRDWMRVYVPAGSELMSISGQNGEVKISDEFEKNVFGMLVNVPVGTTKTISLEYALPDNVKNIPYRLLIQKQSGSGELPFDISLKYPDGSEKRKQEVLTEDKNFSF